MKKEFVNRCAIFIQINFRSTKFEKWLAGTEFTMIQEPRPRAERYNNVKFTDLF